VKATRGAGTTEEAVLEADPAGAPAVGSLEAGAFEVGAFEVEALEVGAVLDAIVPVVVVQFWN